jgi:murein L,D-transpeptidase YafK
MKKLISVSIFLCFLFIPSLQATKPVPTGIRSTFKEDQKRNSRVKVAYAEKENGLKKLLKENSIELSDLKIFIRVFKKEAWLEVWASGRNESVFSLVKTYDICSSSGNPGPKRKAGDEQVPEGFYHIESFNPSSSFYLSLKVSYPNQADRILNKQQNLGGDIFIHGNCVTIGCVPITDDKIKEVYLLAVEAKNAGQSIIPVHIFPCKMNNDGMKYLEKEFPHQQALVGFWKNLKQGFDFFESGKKIPAVSIKKDGSYSFSAQ